MSLIRLRTPRIVPLAVLTALAVASPSVRANADEKEACVASSDQAQTLRDEGKFRAARAQLVSCSRDVCPSIVRRDCEKWLNELDSTQPTVVLGARDPRGNDAPSTRVMLDGALLVSRLEGKPVPIDPGEHTFRYEAPGAAPVEQHAVIRVGEKNRILTAVVMPLAASNATTQAPAPPSEPDVPASSSGQYVPVAAIVFASVAAVSAGSFAYFGLSGRSDVSNLRSTCAPNCTQDQVNSAKTKLLLSDVSLGVGIVALVGAGYFFFHGSSASPQQSASLVQADVEPRRGGGVASVTAHF